jgi:hypothetical protein
MHTNTARPMNLSEKVTTKRLEMTTTIDEFLAAKRYSEDSSRELT